MLIEEEIYESAKKRIPSQKEQVFAKLKSSGKNGVTNVELNEICFRYGHSIYLLKLDGYDIQLENLGDGLVRYTLLDTPLQRVNYQKGIDVVKKEINQNYNGSITADELVQLLDLFCLNIVRKPNGLNKKNTLVS